MNIIINKDQCKGCLTCTKVCPEGHIQNNKNNCLKCLQCISSCKQEAITCDNPSFKKVPTKDATVSLRRRSHRHFKNEQVNDELIKEMINKANTAPAMGGLKDERLFTVVTNEETIKELRLEILKTINKYTKMFNIFRKVFFFNTKMKKNFDKLYRIFSLQYKENQKKDMLFREAPHLLLISTPKTISGGKDNCLYAMNTFLITAEEENIGTCMSGFLSGFHKEVSNFLNLPKDHIIHAGIVFGHPEIIFPFKAFRTDAKINLI